MLFFLREGPVSFPRRPRAVTSHASHNLSCKLRLREILNRFLNQLTNIKWYPEDGHSSNALVFVSINCLIICCFGI